MRKYVNEGFKHILHGGDYNPDQWLKYPEILSEDMRLMKAANCNEMSVGIFAWSKLEPNEGEFNFEWLDKVLDDIYANGGRVFLATPSGARPAWLAEKYPEVLRVTPEGVQRRFGARHNHCYTSPIYREKVAIINRKLAERYGNHPAVIGWHISNEYGGECHCDKCCAAFREWLKEKYGTIENLNDKWWNDFWAHNYNSFDQIDPPSMLSDYGVHARNIDWLRFVTHQTVDFMKHEISVVKSVTPNIPTTTNLMGFFRTLDYREIAKYIDFVSWDNYPVWHGDESDILSASQTGMVNDLMRSLKQQPFVLMECTPSLVNWQAVNKLKRPGRHTAFSLQTVAHGADGILYFQWRKSRGSSEKFHGAVVDHEGSENTRVFKEVSALGARLKKLDEIVGTVTEAKVAMLYDWSNRWGLEDAQGFQRKDKKHYETFRAWYHTLWKRGIDVDIISPEDDFSKYKVIVDPMHYMVSNEMGDKLKSFVKDGGSLLCTYITAMVDEYDLCHLGGFPGAGLREVFGIWNEEIDTLFPEESNTVIMDDGREFRAVDYCELIHDETAKVIARYNSDFYSGMPAATVNEYGSGKAYYVAFRDTGDFADSIINTILKEQNINSAFDGDLPYGVTAHSRTDGETIYVFVENHTNDIQKVTTKNSWINVENCESISGEITLNPLEVIIIKKKC